MSESSRLSLINLTKRYGPIVAAENVSLEVGNEFLTLLGPSGSGKTTTLNMIAGFIQPTSGDILIDGASVAGIPPYRRGIGVVFQNYALFPHLSVFDNIAFPLQVRKLPGAAIRPRVEEILDLVGLSGLGDRRPRELSGGQQQRVAIARALVFKPPVLLMDEPMGALDRKLRLRLQVEIRELQRRLGITVVHVTHDQEEALVMSDRIVVMNQSRIEQIGKPVELYERPANRFVADFIGESNFLPVRIVGQRDGGTATELGGSVTVVVAAATNHVTGSEALLSLRPEEISVKRSSVGAENAVPADIESAAFFGDSTRYLLRSGDLRLMARVPRSGEHFQPGDRAFACWSASEGRLVDEDARSADRPSQQATIPLPAAVAG